MQRLQSPMVRLAILALAVAITVGLVIWHGPDTDLVANAFEAVTWSWVAIAVGLNLLSVVVRTSSWRVIILQAIPKPWPSWRVVFSAFCVGLLGNVALPGRVGELARVAVITRHLRRRPGTWATIVGTVFAHRLFDVVAATGLVVYVLYTSRIPDWAKPAPHSATAAAIENRTRSIFTFVLPDACASTSGPSPTT